MVISNHLVCLLRNMHVIKKQQLEPDMEQWTGSKLGKRYVKAVYCHPTYKTYMSCSRNHKLESELLGEISITSDMQIVEELMSLLVREESEKAGLKLNMKKA